MNRKDLELVVVYSKVDHYPEIRIQRLRKVTEVQYGYPVTRPRAATSLLCFL
jgi:hypothetical protein